MKCPVCKDVLVGLEFDGVEVDWCGACGGVWLDRGELELLHSEAHQAEKFLAGLKQVDEPGQKKRKCPICSARLVPVESAWDRSVVLDSCPKRHGIWFDRGELTQVLSAGGEKTDRVKNFLSGIFGEK